VFLIVKVTCKGRYLNKNWPWKIQHH